MMMSYLQQSNTFSSKPGKGGPRFLVVIVMVIAIMFAAFPKTFSSIIYNVVTPLWRSENHDANAMNELRRQIDSYATVEEKLKILTKENEDLKQSFGRTTTHKIVLGAVLKRPPSIPYDSLIIDAGSEEGISEGAFVSSFGGNPIGIIDSVSRTTSKVKLFSSPGFEHDVLISDKKLPVTVMGVGGGNFNAKVAHDLDIKIGDVVTLPGLHIAILGVVEEIIVDPSRSFKTVYFKQPVSLAAISWVEVSK